MLPATACDRCHGIKSRCTYSEGGNACDRCSRLGHKCETVRRIGKAGRPQTRARRQPSSNSPVQSGDAQSTTSSQLSPRDDLSGLLSDFEPSEVRLAHYLVKDQRLDRRFVNSFAAQASFRTTMESTLIRQLLTAPEQVKDALLALSGALLAEEDSTTEMASAEAMANMQRCCSALEKLRTSETATLEDAVAVMFVATSLVSFNDLTVGYGYLPVARASLLAAEPWLTQFLLAASSEFDPNLIPLVFAELMECGKSGQMPTFRWSGPSRQLIDRSYGISHEVLPYLYDICVLFHDMKEIQPSHDELNERIIGLSIQLEHWLPQIDTSTPEYFELGLTADHEAQIVHHAQCYKLLAQLLLAQIQSHAEDTHFIRHHLAQSLRDAVRQFNTTDQPQVLYLLYPYFVACTEIQDATEQANVLMQMKHLSGGIATQSCNRMFQFLQFVWTSAAVDANATWLDLVDNGPDFSIGP